MPVSSKKKSELKALAERAEAILKEMEDEDQQSAPKRALNKKKRMGTSSKWENKSQRRQLDELDKENY